MATRSCIMAAARMLARPTKAGRVQLALPAMFAPMRTASIRTSPLQTSFVSTLQKPMGLRLQTFVCAATAEQATTSVYVGNLPFSVTDEDIREWFQEIGEVAGVRIGVDQYGKTRGFAHVDFVDPASAAKAVKYDGEELNGRALRIDLSTPRAPRAPVEADGLTCFVKGFDSYDEATARSALTEAFSPYGEVKEVILPMDRDTRTLKGFGYVVFTEANGANVKAAQALSGAFVAGGKLTTDSNATSQKRAPANREGYESDGKTIFVKGFDSYLGEDTVRSALTESFAAYGEVAEVRLPIDRDNNCLKGFGYVVFANADGGAARAATEMSGAECAGGSLFIDPNPRPQRTSGGRGGGRGGYERRGGYGGDRRSSGGRGGGSRRDNSYGDRRDSYSDRRDKSYGDNRW